MKLIKDKLLVCKNCGQVHDYLTADECIEFYENRHKMKRKSVCHRKYHILNVINDIAHNNNIHVGYYNREKIFRTQKNPGIKNFIPKKIIRSSPSLEIPSTPPPPPPFPPFPGASD